MVTIYHGTFYHNEFDKLLDNLGKLCSIASKVDPEHPKYLDKDLRPLKESYRYFTLDVKQHYQLSKDKQSSNIHIITNFLQRVVKILIKKNLVDYNVISDSATIFNFKGHTTNPYDTNDPLLIIDLSHEKNFKLLHQIIYNNEHSGQFCANGLLTINYFRYNPDDQGVLSLIRYVKSDGKGYENQYQFMSSSSGNISKESFARNVSNGDLQLLVTDELPFPKTMKNSKVKNFIKYHPQLSNNKYQTLVLYQVVSYEWKSNQQNPVIKQARVLKKLIYIPQLNNGHLYLEK
jgi:hypothetical protein